MKRPGLWLALLMVTSAVTAGATSVAAGFDQTFELFGLDQNVVLPKPSHKTSVNLILRIKNTAPPRTFCMVDTWILAVRDAQEKLVRHGGFRDGARFSSSDFPVIGDDDVAMLPIQIYITDSDGMFRLVTRDNHGRVDQYEPIHAGRYSFTVEFTQGEHLQDPLAETFFVKQREKSLESLWQGTVTTKPVIVNFCQETSD